MAGKDDWGSSHELDALHIVFIFLVWLDGKAKGAMSLYPGVSVDFFSFGTGKKHHILLCCRPACLSDTILIIIEEYLIQCNATPFPMLPLRQQNQINQCIQSLLVPVELVPPLFQSGLLASRILV